MYPPLIGSICLGIVMGWLVRYFLARFEQFNAKILGSVASVLCGGIVLRFLGNDLFYAVTGYPIGLLIGVVAYPILSALDRLFHANDPNSRPRSTPKKKRGGSRSDGLEGDKK
jgi:NhaP-type Na+/H+ or K+/H+ antiporter